MLGRQGARVDRPVPASLEDLVPADDFYRHLDRGARPGLRPRPGAGHLRAGRAAEHRPGGLLPPAAGPLLRGAAQSERQLVGGGQPAPDPPLVPGLRPRGAAPRPLQPDPHPRAPGWRSSGASSRPSWSGARRRGWSGAGSSTSTGRRWRPTPRWTRCAPASRRGPPRGGSSPSGGDAGDGPPRRRRRARAGSAAPRAPSRPGAPRRRRGRAANGRRHDWLAEGGRQDRAAHPVRPRPPALRAAGPTWRQPTDPDATPMGTAAGGARLGYKTHYVVDGGRPASSSPPWSPPPRCGTTSRRWTCSGAPASAGGCAPAGHGGHQVRHRREHRRPGGRGHPGLRPPGRH